MSLLKDWECMTALLLENADNQKEGRWAAGVLLSCYGAGLDEKSSEDGRGGQVGYQ